MFNHTSTEELAELKTLMGGKFNDLFECMDIAETVIAEYAKQYPTKRALLDGCFGVLTPYQGMTNPRLFEAHCRELLDRVVFDQNLDLATEPEILWGLLMASLTVAAHGDATALTFGLFEKFFGKDAVPGHTPREYYEGSLQSLLAQLRKRARVQRGKPKPRRTEAYLQENLF